MRPATDQLARGEWAVLALLAEKPAHGWEVSRQFAPDGEIGQIWSGDRQRVYRAIRKLAEQSLIEALLTEPGQGAYRTVYRPTAAGREMLARWLAEPVEHMRDASSTFVLKLVFTQRAGLDTTPLLNAQRNLVLATMQALGSKLARVPAGSQIHLRVRLETARALLVVIDDLSNATAVRSRTARPAKATRSIERAVTPGVRVSDFTGRPLTDEADGATIILRYGGPDGGIVVASAHVEDPVVGEIAEVAREAGSQRASGQS
jgi:DNA-binding PadR family transcriptional regulator